jgi:hypothetical protein
MGTNSEFSSWLGFWPFGSALYCQMTPISCGAGFFLQQFGGEIRDTSAQPQQKKKLEQVVEK